MTEPLNDEQRVLQDRNRATVEHFLRCHGLERASLFTADGYKVLPWTGMGRPIDMRGQYELKYNFLINMQIFTQWAWSNVQVFDTQFPDQFWVECDGEGVIVSPEPGYEPVYYKNHYLHHFLLEDGKIKEFREFQNAITQVTDAAGEVVPMPPLGDWKPPVDWVEPADWTPDTTPAA
ncbi:PhzA/PhzB family protein [Microbacterium sp.]|uniref:PhzA/PhzB family protein n=1 Tax=Microbacterium sp. TaxID=51671 RepID=UPI0039E4E7DB